jgi:CheY-like chemotaxis protein
MAKKHYNISDFKRSRNQSTTSINFLDLNMPVMGGWEFLDYFNTPEFAEFTKYKSRSTIYNRS